MLKEIWEFVKRPCKQYLNEMSNVAIFYIQQYLLV